MYSPRFFLLILAALCVADAAFLDHFHFGRRADLAASASDTGSKSSSTEGATTPASTPASSSPTSASTTPPASSSSTEPSSSSPTPSTAAPTSAPSPTPTQAEPSSTAAEPSSQQPSPQQPSSQPQQSSAKPTSSEDSNPKSTLTSFVTSTTTQAPAITSGATPTPGLSSDKDGATSGMPAKTRNTVIGVVVGIGGAILLGAAGMVAYRIWGRRKHSEESDGLMSYDMSTNGYEKHEPSNSISSNNQRTPFQSTLDNYHQPSNVNPSHNF